MSLSLPPNFENDIQGKDTALVPVIVISTGTTTVGELYISTNIHHVRTFPTNFMVTCKPLLLNIPSLKESIDIEKRNYKISSINLDISNFKYEGKRFSELIGDISLINTEVRIFWTSPSADVTAYYDIQSEYGDDYPLDDWALQIFNGTIRRYTHDDEKVRLVVEDKSQATLHKDLPLPGNYLTGDEVPDKYKNKPIPMVYGRVDRSPCVVKNNIVNNVTNIDFYCDSSSATSFNEELLDVNSIPITPLSFFENGYVGILPIIDDDLGSDNLYETGNQYNINNNILTLASAAFKNNDDFLYYNSIGDNVAYCRKISIPKSIRLLNENDNYAPTTWLRFYWGYGENGEILNTIQAGDVLNLMNYTNAAINIVGHINHHVNNESIEENSGQGAHIIENTTFQLNVESLPEHRITNTVFYFIGNFSIENTSFGEENEYSSTKLYVGIQPVNDHYFGTGGTTLYLGVSDGSDTIDYASSISSSRTFNVNTEDDYYKRIIDMDIPLSPQLIINPVRITNDFDGSSTWCDYSANISKIGFITKFYIEKLLDKDFYANVNGRAMQDNGDSPTAPSVIKNILENELGVTGIDPTGTYDWQYAFTVDKKINSKKLIEGIASASPYIPRFNNMGEFIFTEIPMGGGSVTLNPDESTSPNHTIKEVDVIDFSFSRTKIEDVYTKIIFKYNWDYARGEFNDSVEVSAEADYLYTDSIYAYYGFQGTDDDHDADSTLTIDDDRGKYIRNNCPTQFLAGTDESYIADATARAFAGWYLMWNLNQHLKMKIKLPLKYMNLEIGDFVDFDEILGDVKPYGIDYTDTGAVKVNQQIVYTTFLITSTNKTLEWVEIECVQMHDLNIARLTGCMDDGYQQWSPNNGVPACNYDEYAVVNTGCEYEVDCAGTCGGDLEFDCCGICGGDAVCDNCDDCAGDEELVFDDCGVCGGDGSSCADCAGVPNGDAEFDNCSFCVGGTTGLEACEQDCSGEWGGSAVYDECVSAEFPNGVCGGDNSSCMVCPEGDELVALWNVGYPLGQEVIDLSNQGLTGSIPPEIGCLTELRILKLFNNQITGVIPSSIGNLTNLTDLWLSGNQLSGEIPPEIGDLENLVNLYLYNNGGMAASGLTGEIPPEIGDLTNLLELRLHHNKLTGQIPSEIGSLMNLNNLTLENNQLTGSIPASICNIPDECYINVSNNHLCDWYNYGCIDNWGEQTGNIDCSECPNLGDLNGDGGINVLDVVAMIQIILGDTGDIPCEGDMNGDGGINVLDVVSLVQYILA